MSKTTEELLQQFKSLRAELERGEETSKLFKEFRETLTQLESTELEKLIAQLEDELKVAKTVNLLDITGLACYVLKDLLKAEKYYRQALEVPSDSSITFSPPLFPFKKKFLDEMNEN